MNPFTKFNGMMTDNNDKIVNDKKTPQKNYSNNYCIFVSV